jgi:hypothetical protein
MMVDAKAQWRPRAPGVSFLGLGADSEHRSCDHGATDNEEQAAVIQVFSVSFVPWWFILLAHSPPCRFTIDCAAIKTRTRRARRTG